MTKEETKYRIKLMQSYLSGKAIQHYNEDNGVWEDVEEPTWGVDVKYRIKPKSNVRPYTFEELKEAIKRHGTAVVDANGSIYTIVFASESVVALGAMEAYAEFANNRWLDDNSPCGVIE